MIELLDVDIRTFLEIVVAQNVRTKSSASSHTSNSELRRLSNRAHVPTVIPGCLYIRKAYDAQRLACPARRVGIASLTVSFGERFEKCQ